MRIEELLAPWEYDVSAPPRLVSHIEADDCHMAQLEEGQERRLIFRRAGDDGCWTLSGKAPDFPPDFRHVGYVPAPWFLRQAVRLAWRDSQFVRLFFLRKGEPLWRVSLAPSGVGTCRTLGKKLGPLTPFDLGRETGALSSSQTHALLASQALDAESPFAFAMRFHQLTEEEKLACLFDLDLLNYKRAQQGLDDLLRLVLHTEATLPPDDEELFWQVGARSGSEFVSRDQWRQTAQDSNSPRLKAWANALRDFGPLQPQLLNLSLTDFWNYNRDLSECRVQAPTSHEQLEARLKLREWAQLHLPPDVRLELERLEP